MNISFLGGDTSLEGVLALLIRYVCDCCDRLVEEVLIDDEMLDLVLDNEPLSNLTSLSHEDIISLERQGSLVLTTVCADCRRELELAPDDTLSVNAQFIN